MGHAGDEHDDEPDGSLPDEGGHQHRWSALPDPLDRLWLHPSELSPLVGSSSGFRGAGAATRTRPVWTTTLAAGAAGAILTLGMLGAVGAFGRTGHDAPSPDVVPTTAHIASAQAVAIAVGRSVVAVTVRDKSGTRRGSGVCIRRANEILTSDRLVGSSTQIRVTTADGAVHDARVLGRDATTDLVLLRLARGVAAAPSATTSPQPGDTVWVVGAPTPGDTSPWMSSGVVASTDSLVAVQSGPTTSGLLETAAASNAATSGGALVDSAGNLTGIVLSPVGDGRMTYAVPIATALSIADDLRTYGYATHGALGINGTDKPTGPTITGVVAGGPAALAGMRAGDIVERVDKHEVDSMEQLMALVRHDSPGQPITVELRRGTHTLTMQATLTSMVTR